METGIALLVPVAFPEEREHYENIALQAIPMARCPQCGLPNKHQEVSAVLVFRPGSKFFIQLPASADERVVEQTRSLVSGISDAGWTMEISRDPARFRSAALAAIFGLIKSVPFNELGPARGRDFAYHAALMTVTRPGLLHVLPGQDGLSDNELADTLRDARRHQIASSFLDAFAEMDVALLDPIREVVDLFPPECLETESMALLYASIEALAAEDRDVAALRAALAAAAQHGGLQRPTGVDLARGLVRQALSGASFAQDPQVWASLLTAEDIYRAIGIEAPPSNQAELERVLAVAETLGHGGAVASIVMERTQLHGLTEDRVADFIETVVAAAEKQGGDDAALGASLSPLARMGDLEVAVRAALAVVDRLIDERPLAVVGVVRETAARLKNEGEGERALALLDAVEPRFPPGALPAEARSDLLNERANALRELHHLEDALRLYRQSIAVHPGNVEDADLRVALLNEARTLRDVGRLQRSLNAFTEILPHTSGRERFECLFGMTITHQRAGDWEAAQTAIEEAYECVGSAPVDDQVARFAAAASFNARMLGLPEQITQLELHEAVEASDYVTARQKLLTLGATAAHTLQAVPSDELCESTLAIARGLDPPMFAESDPEMALTWLSVARLAGDQPLAWTTAEALLARRQLPFITMRAASIAAQMACAAEHWDDAARFVERAIEAAVSIAGTGSQNTTSLGIVETIGEVRDLGAAISRAPAEPKYDTLISRLADTQCSLLLSLRLGEVGASSALTSETPLQVLQWLDAGAAQIPMLTCITPRGRESMRGPSLETTSAHGLGARIAGRITRSPALRTDDLVEGVEQYRAFRGAFLEATAPLDIDPSQPLTIVPSAALVGIPLHHALPKLDIAYSPSLAVTAALSRRVSEDARCAAAIAEVRCACFNDESAITEALIAGGEALAALCKRRELAEYRCIDGLGATANAVEGLLANADIVKLSCHGVADATAGRYALLLSDGMQLPPPLGEIATRDDLAEQYLFDWGDLTQNAERCRLVVSSACGSGSGLATGGGEQIGLMRAYLASGVLSFVAPMWPVAAKPAQAFVNAFIEECLASPSRPLAVALHQTQIELSHLPRRVRDAFVVHGHAGPIFTTTTGENQ